MQKKAVQPEQPEARPRVVLGRRYLSPRPWLQPPGPYTRVGQPTRVHPYVGHNTELTCNVAQAAPSVINTTYQSLKSGHKVTTLHAPRRHSCHCHPHSQAVWARPRGQDDAHSIASCPSLVSYNVNRCLGPVMGQLRRRLGWRGTYYVD
jgi:hypothetical protein